jgi:hypothetical protein
MQFIGHSLTLPRVLCLLDDMSCCILNLLRQEYTSLVDTSLSKDIPLEDRYVIKSNGQTYDHMIAYEERV